MVLPTTFNMPIFWEESDLELLQGSLVGTLVEISRRHLTSIFNNIIVPFMALYESKRGTPIKLTLEDLKWATSCVYSRGYWLDEAETEPCLVPLADMLNHMYAKSADCGAASYGYEPSRKSFRIVSKRSYKSGEEVFTFYGCKSNFEFLNDYGFILPRSIEAPESLFVQIPVWKIWDDDEESTELYNLKADLLEQAGLGNHIVHLCREKGHSLVIAARIMAMSKEDTKIWSPNIDTSNRLLRNEPVRPNPSAHLLTLTIQPL